MEIKHGSHITVWFSCGAASAVAAKKTLELYKNIATITIVNNPIKEEHPDNARFLLDVQDWLGVEIHSSVNPKFPNASCVEVWEKRKYMSGVSGAPCTLELKKNARLSWEHNHKIDYHVLGFTVEEKKRSDRFILMERSNLIPVLVNLNISKADCFDILRDNNIRLPEIYKMGFNNANCIGCVKAASPTYWNLVREKFPDVFANRAELSRKIGAKLVIHKGKRMYLDELDPLAKGRKMKDFNIDCGIFCEEKE